MKLSIRTSSFVLPIATCLCSGCGQGDARAPLSTPATLETPTAAPVEVPALEAIPAASAVRTEEASALADAASMELSGAVKDFAGREKMQGVTHTCVIGEPVDGVKSQRTKEDESFHWVLKKGSKVQLLFTFKGWNVVPPCERTKDGDLVSWDPPSNAPQLVEMARTTVALEKSVQTENYMRAVGSRFAERARSSSNPANTLAQSWAWVESSPLPGFARVYVANGIVGSELPAGSVPQQCALYAKTDASAALRWDHFVREADEKGFALPSLSQAELTMLPHAVVTDSFDSAIRARWILGGAGKLDRVALEDWSRKENLSLDKTLKLVEDLKRIPPR